MAETKTEAVQTLAVALRSREAEFAVALPREIRADRFMRQVITAAQINPRILECDTGSIVLSAMTAAQAGLEIDPTFSEGALVPRWSSKLKRYVCTFMPMYQGLLKLAMEHPNVQSVTADVVHEADRFEVQRGAHPDLVHVPALKNDRGPILYTYAVAFMREGPPLFAIMSRAEVEVIRARATAAAKRQGIETPWDTDWPEMAKKTAIRRLWKLMPRVSDRPAAGRPEKLRVALEAEGLEESTSQDPAGSTISEESVPQEGGEPEVSGIELAHRFARELLIQQGCESAASARAFLSERLGRTVTAVNDLTEEDAATLAEWPPAIALARLFGYAQEVPDGA